jgi:predicted transcriptional regulator
MTHRRRDPSTSVEASASAQVFINRHQSVVLAAIAKHGPAGKTRLSEVCGMDHVSVCRRFSELVAAGLIVADGHDYSRTGKRERRFRIKVAE